MDDTGPENTLRDAWKSQLETLGGFIRTQRRMANLTLRDMSELAKVSNPYLSQIERGLHEPSVRVLKSIASALDLSVETLLVQAGLLEDDGTAGRSEDPTPDKVTPDKVTPDTVTLDTVSAITIDPKLSEEQKDALLAVYRGFLRKAQ